MNPTTQQRIAGRTVSIVRTKDGERFAKIVEGRNQSFIPVPLLSLSASKDAWMRQILVQCRDCRAPHKAEELECELCPDCFDLACQENEQIDPA